MAIAPYSRALLLCVHHTSSVGLNTSVLCHGFLLSILPSATHRPFGNTQALFICIFMSLNTGQQCSVSHIDSGFHLSECGYYLLYFRCQYEWLSSTDRCAFEVEKKKDWHDFWHYFCQDFSIPFAGIPSLMNTFYSSGMCNLMLCYLFSSLISKCQSSVGKLC